jgi:hypothetical protein
VGGALALSTTMLRGQVTVPLPPTVDSAAIELDPTPRWRQTLLLRAARRSYTIDEATATDYRIRETALSATYQLRGERFALRAEMTPVRYSATAQLAAPSRTEIAGYVPTLIRAEWRWRDGDTTRVYVRTGTSPLVLDTAQSRAIGVAGTSTLDLEAGAFGAQFVYGVRHAIRVVNRNGVSVGVRTAIEASPAPTGDDLAYWTGTNGRSAPRLTRGRVWMSRGPSPTT